MPAFRLERLDDPAQHWGPEALKGRVWLLNVWASWCGPCRQEHPLLLELARRGGPTTLVGLAYSDERSASQNWLRRHGNPYAQVLLDARAQSTQQLRIVSLPETWVVDRQGVVRWRHSGPLTPELLQQTLLPLLARLERS